MADLQLLLPDSASTMALGARLAPIFKAGDVIALSGPLGAGKTTLARGVIGALAGGAEAPSPTFALVETYDAGDFQLWHFDLYRVENAAEVWELGLEEALAGGVALIEWPERIASLLPASALFVRLSLEVGGRLARLRAEGDWEKRLARASLV